MTPMTPLIIFFLIAVNAFYVAAEFSSVSVRRSRVRHLAENGNALARRLLPTLEDPRKLDRHVATCQIGITIASLVLGAYGQASLATSLMPLFQHWGGMKAAAAHSTAAVVVLIGLTLLQVILGELVPKALALQYPARTAIYTSVVMRVSQVAFSWFLKILNGSGVAILKLLRAPHGTHRHIHSPEEIDMLLVQSRDGGLLEPDEQQRLHEAIRLNTRQAHELMVPRRHLAAIEKGTPLAEVLQLAATCPYSRLPVYVESIENIVGMLHIKDLAVHYLEQRPISSIEKLVRPVLYVPESVNAYNLLALLRERRCHQAIVVDEFGGCTGLVTLEDILTEVFGDVSDEYKTELDHPEVLPDGRVRLPGLMRLDDAVEWTGVHWEGEANTVGGHVTETLGHIPAVGEQVTITGVNVEVERVASHAVTSVIVTPVTGREEEADG